MSCAALGASAGDSDESQMLAHALGHRLELQRRAGDVTEEVLRRPALALSPELAQERAGLTAREPGVAELLAQVCPQLRLERPRAQVCGDVEARVDVAEVVDGARLDLQRIPEQLDVARTHRRQVGGGVELELVEELRAVPADEEERVRGSLGCEVGR